MVDVVYLGDRDADATRRLDLLRQQKLSVSDDGADTATVTVLDGRTMEEPALEEQLQRHADGPSRCLVLFALPRGVSFRDRRETLLAAGADDVMNADGPDDEFITRVRALILTTIAPRVLVVEDDPDVQEWTVKALTEAGMETAGVGSLAEARARFEAGPVDALVVDRTLPDGDGLDFVAFLRDSGIRTPALLFTALDNIGDRIRGLEEARADDYICKPVHEDELRARVHVLLRPRVTEETLFFGPLEINRRDQMVKWRGDRIELRRKECQMLIYLAERAGLPIPQRMIYQDVWEKVFMDIGSNPVTAARHRLVRDIKAFLKERDETYTDFIGTDGECYVLLPGPLLKLSEG